MVYTGHLVQTRAAARGLILFFSAMLTPFLIRQLRHLDWSQFGQMAGLLLLTLLPFLVSDRCLRFLKKQEAEHANPTPEMSFIFGVAISVPLAISAAALIVLNP